MESQHCKKRKKKSANFNKAIVPDGYRLLDAEHMDGHIKNDNLHLRAINACFYRPHQVCSSTIGQGRHTIHRNLLPVQVVRESCTACLTKDP